MNRLLFRDFGAFMRARRVHADLCAVPDVTDHVLFTRFGHVVVLPPEPARVLLMLMAADGPLSRADLMADESEAALAAFGRRAHPSETVDRRIGAIRRKACAALGILVLGSYRKGWSLYGAAHAGAVAA